MIELSQSIQTALLKPFVADRNCMLNTEGVSLTGNISHDTEDEALKQILVLVDRPRR